MTAAPVTYAHHGPSQALAIIEDLRTIYSQVFSGPPYDEPPEMADQFTRWLKDESENPGFDLTVARVDSVAVGFAYGYTMPPGDWFRHMEGVTPSELLQPAKFAVMEWAVLPSSQRAGIGRHLMRSLLDSRPEPLAALTVHPDAPAFAIYQRDGWRHVGNTEATRKWPSMRIMVLKLHA